MIFGLFQLVVVVSQLLHPLVVAEQEVSEETESEDSPAVESDRQDFESMTVAELKELLKAAGKPVSGKKADLIARLQE